MNQCVTGNLRKMLVSLPMNGDGTADYQLIVGEEQLSLNQYLNHELSLTFTGKINCIHCGRKSNKSFSQGYCYPCFKSLARCDQCIMKPENCHFHLGTCREPDWAQEYCMQDHYVYLANSSGVKVGITRGDQIPIRWIDQGASQALAVYRVKNRYLSGLVEVLFKEHVSDRTNWRAMLKSSPELQDLHAIARDLQQRVQPAIDALRDEHGIQSISSCDDARLVDIQYPIHEFPAKVVSANFDKEPTVSGTLTGIKGQYLMFGNTVINIRKFSGYEVEARY